MSNIVKNKAAMHRYKNGRLQIDYFSRQQRPKWSMIEIDGEYYDRDAIHKFVIDRSNTIVPKTLRKMTKSELEAVINKNPFKIK
jgi:hypothetical protein